VETCRGTCHAIFAFEVANAIDLEGAERRIAAAQRQTVQQKERAPSYFEYRPAPLRVSWQTPSLPVGRFATTTAVDLVMYDFGAVSLSYAIPFDCSLPDLLPLSVALRGRGALVAEARQHVAQLLALLQDAAVRPSVAPVIEDYVVFEVLGFDPPLDASGVYAAHAGTIAQILRAEARTLSTQERDAAIALRASYSPGDITVIDADAALVCDPDGADIRAVIEFANAQLLEMRLLDQQLDDTLERSYQLLSRQRWQWRAFSFYDPDIRQVARLQVDAAVLFEQVTNALKLIGEQYLTRVYDLVTRRFHLPQWDAAISRKLSTVESIYGKMSDRAATRRMELLEWIIIILIAVSIVLTLPGVLQ
jgi:hypothetical protein